MKTFSSGSNSGFLRNFQNIVNNYSELAYANHSTMDEELDMKHRTMLKEIKHTWLLPVVRFADCPLHGELSPDSN